MPKDQPIIYEPHPVSVARKAELRGQGFKILDAVFAPPGTTVVLPATAPLPAIESNPAAATALALAGGNFMAFKSAAKKVLGDALPGTKPEIIAALEAIGQGDDPVIDVADGVPTPVPEAWDAMTDDELLALAAELSGGPVVASGDATPVERAKSIIRATVEDRAIRNG